MPLGTDFYSWVCGRIGCPSLGQGAEKSRTTDRSWQPYNRQNCYVMEDITMCWEYTKTLLYLSTIILLYTRLHVSTFLNGHHQTF